MAGKTPSFRIFSDLDDTIKISNTQNKLVTFYRGLFRSSAFLGMAELYQEWVIAAGGEGYTVHIVSASPPVLHRRIKYFLKKNGFPDCDLWLRHWLTQPSITRYKSETLVALASQHPEPLILVGDDTEQDPEILSRFRKRYPHRVLATYVRQIKGRKLPDGVSGFFTAFDIACAEVSAGRLTPEQAARVGKAVLQTKKYWRLIPYFSVRPPLEFIPLIPEGEKKLQELWTKIQSKLQNIPKRLKK